MIARAGKDVVSTGKDSGQDNRKVRLHPKDMTNSAARVRRARQLVDQGAYDDINRFMTPKVLDRIAADIGAA